MRKETRLELVLNTATHGVGVGLSIFVLAYLLIHTTTTAHSIAVLVFGISMIFLYMSSTLYHAFPQSMINVRSVLRRFDHSAIYLLIVGTYTPFIAILFPNTVGLALLGTLWTIAISGVLLKIFLFHRFKIYHYVMYLVMGWSIVFIWPAIHEIIPTDAMRFLVLGGIAYTVGFIFFTLKNVPFMHLVWHMFVIAGTTFHFFSIFNIL